MAFLPVCKEDMELRGWEELDFLFVSGDAYIDHPSFGTAIICNLLVQRGYRVGVCAIPDVNDKSCLKTMGRPSLGVLVSSGVVDSMVNNYTASKKPRSDDKYYPENFAGKRPDRCLTSYCNMVREQFGEIPLIIGGVEASLRRFAHYDYWSGKVRRSIIQDCSADILVYGMGEKAIIQIADLLSKGANVKKINSVEGTCVFLKPEDMPKSCENFVMQMSGYKFSSKTYTNEQIIKGVLPRDEKYVLLPDFDEVSTDKNAYIAAFKMQYEEQVPGCSKTLLQKHSQKYVVHNPPQKPLSEKELDETYSLDYERNYHPSYESLGGVSAIKEVKFSISSHRGCFGGCHFCAITFHQGKIVRHRSLKSIEQEAIKITHDPEFKGYIHDVGGPTANFYNAACEKQERGEYCKNKSCLFPEICPMLKIDHTDYLNILRKLRSIDKVKKVFIRSGIRFDYVINDKKTNFLSEICKYHISGQLKVAPEHTSDRVLSAMGKPPSQVYNEFKDCYTKINQKLGMKQFLVPYLISGHPGSTLDDAIGMAIEIKKSKVLPEQVQDFYPTPGTVSTTMYYTGKDPFTLEEIHVPDYREKQLQRALLRFSDPKNRKLAEIALWKAGRGDLIGYGPDCLIRPLYKHNKNKSDNETGENVSSAKEHITNKNMEDKSKTRNKMEEKSYGKSYSRERNVSGNKGRNKITSTGSRKKIR